MITKEKLQNALNIYNENTVSRSNVFLLGFTRRDLPKLEDAGFLVRTGYGKYRFNKIAIEKFNGVLGQQIEINKSESTLEAFYQRIIDDLERGNYRLAYRHLRDVYRIEPYKSNVDLLDLVFDTFNKLLIATGEIQSNEDIMDYKHVLIVNCEDKIKEIQGILLETLRASEVKMKNEVYSHIANGEYKQAASLLRDKKKRCELSIEEQAILKLLTVLMNIEKSNSMPQKKSNRGEDILKAISCHDFDKIAHIVSLKDDGLVDYKIIKLILGKINEKKTSLDVKEHTLNYIFMSLMKRDIEETKKYINMYFGNNIESIEIAYYMAWWCVLQNDSEPIHVVRDIQALKDGNMSLTRYMHYLTEALEYHAFLEAELLLNIITRSNQEVFRENDLNAIKIRIQQDKNAVNMGDVSAVSFVEKVVSQRRTYETIRYAVRVKPASVDFDKEITALLTNGGIKVLGPLSESQVSILKSRVGGLDNIDLMDISTDGITYYAIRFLSGIKMQEARELVAEAEDAIEKGDYRLAKEKLVQSLGRYYSPTGYVYAKLSFCCYKLGEISETLKYNRIVLHYNSLDEKNPDRYMKTKNRISSLEGASFKGFLRSEQRKATIQQNTIEFGAFSDILIQDWNASDLLVEKFRLTPEELAIVKLTAIKKLLEQGVEIPIEVLSTVDEISSTNPTDGKLLFILNEVHGMVKKQEKGRSIKPVDSNN